MQSLTIFTDGGSRGNPGESGIGVVIYDEEEKMVWERGKAIGIHTNNEAEYLALDLASDWLTECKNEGWKACLGLKKVIFKLDSKLVVEQMKDAWKVKEPRMQELRSQVKSKLEVMNLEYEFIHVPREQNKRADELVNQALDLHLAK